MTTSGLGDVRRVHKERHLKPSVGIIDGWLEDEAEGDPAYGTANTRTEMRKSLTSKPAVSDRH